MAVPSKAIIGSRKSVTHGAMEGKSEPENMRIGPGPREAAIPAQDRYRDLFATTTRGPKVAIHPRNTSVSKHVTKQHGSHACKQWKE